MIVFTTLEYLNRRGVATRLSKRYGKNYDLVIIDESTVAEIRQKLSRGKARRVIATIPSRDDLVPWLRQYDGPGVPWPKYGLEGI